VIATRAWSVGLGIFVAHRHEFRKRFVQLQQAPQPQGQPDVAEVPQSVELNVPELDQDRFVVARVVVGRRIKPRRVGTVLAAEPSAQLRPTVPLALLQFAQVRDHPMPRALGRAEGFHQRPVGVPLAVLASLQAFKKHRIPAVKSDPSATRMPRKEGKTRGKVVTTSTLRSETPPDNRANAVGKRQKT